MAFGGERLELPQSRPAGPSASSQMICHYPADPHQSGKNRVSTVLFTKATFSTGGDETPLLCRFVIQRACAGRERAIALDANLAPIACTA
jgi:hypothetical protein